MRLNPCLYWLTALLCLLLSLPLIAQQDATSSTVGERREDVLFWSQAQRQTRFSQMDQLFPADRVARGDHVHVLPQGTPLRLQWKDGATTLDSYMQQGHIAGVMVLQRGQIRLARYAPDFGPTQRWTSFSVAKSFTSTLLGIALREGHIRSLDDPLVRYIPQLHGSAYADVSVRQLLTMTSGVRWNEDYSDPKSDVAQMYRSACTDGQPHVLPYLAKLDRAEPAGTHWNYNTAETDLLGVLVQRATGRSLATYLSQTIWKPYGMAADAWWLKDECDGSDTGGSGLSATLADYARMGQFILDGGRIDGKAVLTPEWLGAATRKQENVDNPDRGYGYQWWTYAGGSYAAIGIFGQLVHIDPKRQLVIVQLAAWPSAGSKALIASRDGLIDAVQRSVDEEAGGQDGN